MNYYKNDKMKTAYYSAMGENHLKSNGENQDAICFEYLSVDKWFVAIADGVSSASHSKEGAIFATEVVKELALSFELHDRINLDELKVWLVRRWKEKIINDWNEYATTLNFVYHSKGYLLVGQIGDGLIWLDIDGKKYNINEYKDKYNIYKNEFALNGLITEYLKDYWDCSTQMLFIDNVPDYVLKGCYGEYKIPVKYSKVTNIDNKMFDTWFITKSKEFDIGKLNSPDFYQELSTGTKIWANSVIKKIA